MTPAEQAQLDDWKSDLTAAFIARRCHCGAQATVVIVGSAGVREMGITLRRAIPDRNLCMFHAGLLRNSEAA